MQATDNQPKQYGNQQRNNFISLEKTRWHYLNNGELSEDCYVVGAFDYEGMPTDSIPNTIHEGQKVLVKTESMLDCDEILEPLEATVGYDDFDNCPYLFIKQINIL